MSPSILNVWITNLGDPCSIADDAASGLPHAWVVAVLHCDGKLLYENHMGLRSHDEEALHLDRDQSLNRLEKFKTSPGWGAKFIRYELSPPSG